MWQLVRNVNSRPHLRPTELETLGMWPRNLWFIKSEKFLYTDSSLRTTMISKMGLGQHAMYEQSRMAEDKMQGEEREIRPERQFEIESLYKLS